MFEVIQVERAFAVINGPDMKLNSQRSQEATFTITGPSFSPPPTLIPIKQEVLCQANLSMWPDLTAQHDC